MIDCQETIRRLWEYLDSTANAADCRLVEQHLVRCRRCRGELEFAVELRRLLTDSHCDELPDDVRRRLCTTLEGPADE